MRWFTREWATGALDESEFERRVSEYQQHLEAIRPDLRDGAEQLLSVNIHDAQVRSWQLTEDGVLHLRVLAGDLQRGYEWLDLRYELVRLVGASSEDIGGWRLDEPGVELLYDEIDGADGGKYEHRILVSPDGEFGIRFSSVELTRQPAQPSDRR